MAVENGKRQFLKVGSSGGMEPDINAIGEKRVVIGDATFEIQLSNVARLAKGEYSIDEIIRSF
jgi:uridine phosphorylase